MSDGERVEAFWKRWGYEPNEQAELERFRVRLDLLMQSLWARHFEPYHAARATFALVSGTRPVEPQFRSYDFSHIHGRLQEPIDLHEIVELVQFVLWSLPDDARQSVCKSLNLVLDLSPTIRVRAEMQGDEAILIRTGAKVLDEALVEGNLTWLGNYPKAAKPFANALQLYFRNQRNEYRNMLDSLRLAVEELVRAVLKNNKSLENQKEDFLRWLKAHGAHSQIANTYHDLLFGKFALYQNEAVKHREDDYTPAEVEFLLYWTGALLRFIQSVSEQGSA